MVGDNTAFAGSGETSVKVVVSLGVSNAGLCCPVQQDEASKSLVYMKVVDGTTLFG